MGIKKNLSWGLVLLTLMLFSCNKEQIVQCAEEILKEKGEVQIIPKPINVSYGKSSINLTELNLFTEEGIDNIVQLFALETEKYFGLESHILQEASKGVIHIDLDSTYSSNPEAYELKIEASGIYLRSTSKTGISRGFQTLKQLLYQYQDKENNSFSLPELTIKDAPAFQHRGMLLDVCRHFFDKEVIKKYIDLLAYYKMNVLHWHLTEDQGWRIEIDKYPLLTEIGAWRTDSAGNKYGGYYSKEEIKEIVSYAEERQITIIPEIELPGHSQAALAAYPQFSCKKHDIEVINDWGVFKEIYCAGNDSTFQFLEDVLTEVMELFPSKYIHIGGDEAPKFRWENCKKCQRRIADESLHNEHGLQSYFISRIEKFLNENERELIGWDEILEGGLSPNATLQSWRGFEYGTTAAKADHQVIMSPTSHCYFDYDLKAIDLEKVYQFDPIPADLPKDKASYIIGGEGNMWTEHVPNESVLDSKVFPRLLAMSEVLWSYPKERDFEPFLDRVQNQYPYLESQGVEYGLEGEAVRLEIMEENKQFYLKLKPGVPKLELKYRTNEKQEYQAYKEPISITFSGKLQVQAFKQEKAYGNVFEQEVVQHNALGIVPQYTHSFNKWYTAGGETGLTNGLMASLDFRDGNWQGFYGNDLEVIIDLKDTLAIRRVSANFYQYNNAWIFFPKQIKVFSSFDGENWHLLQTKVISTPAEKRGKFMETVSFQFMRESLGGRYIKFYAENLKTVPDWHEAAGSKAWIFVDEIIIQ